MTNIWTPLSTRQGADQPLRDDVPAALETALRGWIEETVRDSSVSEQRLLLRCDLVRDPNPAFEPSNDIDDIEFLAWFTPTEKLLDVVDATLNLLPTGSIPTVRTLPRASKPTAFETMADVMGQMTFTKYRSPLQQLLDDGRSAYTIRTDGRALMRRVDRTVAALVGAAIHAAEQPNRGSAGVQLRRAYHAAYALRSDPVRAYSDAIKAVESAAQATLEPNNHKATLGTMLGALLQIGPQLEVAVPGRTDVEGLETVRSMMSMLWDGQVSRHGSQQAIPEETLEQARMAVDIATVLVRWFSAGAIRRR
ncbi:hypothetical protein [Streptomyces fildesensis]|uniref:hypothetical protein n=1 Tax=Streptomyces fildesensis TaxID=375757 RepID=UPI0018DF4E8A|nr:hypothetical protein [Streptomyces fildesensis]